jgi:hypothetical protein
MNPVPPEVRLPFLGQRTYLQGTTIYDALQPMCPEGARRSIKFPHLLQTDRIKLAALPSLQNVSGRPSFVLHWQRGSAEGVITGEPLPPSAQPERVPYDEVKLTDLARFGEQEVELDRPSPYSFCATIVSLNKFLLLARMPSTMRGQWLFTRLDIDAHPAAFVPLRLNVASNLGWRVVHSEIRVGGKRIGALYFNWLDKA